MAQKMTLENTTNKKIRAQNKIRNTQFQKDLQAAIKIEELNARAQQVKETQFRTKYEKYLTTGNFETSLTKNPAFQQASEEASVSNSHNGEHIPLHKLIYTNGEVDIDKVVCLHLMTIHHSRTVFGEVSNLRLFPKRSKPNVLESSILPFYILDIDCKVNTIPRPHLKEGQDVIIIVNRAIEKMVTSILEVLAIVGPLKLKKIKEILLNKKYIQEIMIKTKIFNFLAQLKESPVLINTENYRIEIAQFQEEPDLDPQILSVSLVTVKDKSRKIEQIQQEARQVIENYKSTDTQIISDSWSMCHRSSCSCREVSSKPSINSGRAIALLRDDGTDFALVTKSGCHLPGPRNLSDSSPSLAAIIKSSPRGKNSTMKEERSSNSLPRVSSSFMRNQGSRIINSLLHKVSNTQRILIGKVAAELKSQQANSENPGKQRLPMDKIIERVFSRESLISLAGSVENEELKLLFQPCCKGGLGIGTHILRADKKTSEKKSESQPTKTLEPPCMYKNEAIPQIIRQEKSVMKTAQIKQEIFMSETQMKKKKFLQSENPGETSSPNKIVRK